MLFRVCELLLRRFRSVQFYYRERVVFFAGVVSSALSACLVVKPCCLSLHYTEWSSVQSGTFSSSLFKSSAALSSSSPSWIESDSDQQLACPLKQLGVNDRWSEGSARTATCLCVSPSPLATPQSPASSVTSPIHGLKRPRNRHPSFIHIPHPRTETASRQSPELNRNTTPSCVVSSLHPNRDIAYRGSPIGNHTTT